MTAKTRKRTRHLRYPRYGLETHAQRGLARSHQEHASRWGRRFLAAVLVGYLLFAHGCHGDEEDHELCAWPFPLSSAREPVTAAK